MKAKYILLLAVLALSFTACEQQEPFDTQSPNDAPLILKPYNESGTGSFMYWLADANTPLVDSVVVTPSKYTTVYWYVDSALVQTGTKIDMCFPKGMHDLEIEAVTTAGKKTSRFGLIMVDPTVLWNGPKTIDWDANTMKVTKEQLATVPVGSKIRVFFELLEDQEYYAMRITTPWWGEPATLETDLVLQMDMKGASSPFTFVYDARCKALVEERGAFIVVGNGLKVNYILTD